MSPISKKEELYGKQGTIMNKPSAPARPDKSKAPVKENVGKLPSAAPPPAAKPEAARQEPKKAMDYNPSFQNPPAPEEEEEEVRKPAVQTKEEKKLTISPFGIQQSITRTIPGNQLKKAKKKCVYLILSSHF